MCTPSNTWFVESIGVCHTATQIAPRSVQLFFKQPNPWPPYGWFNAIRQDAPIALTDASILSIKIALQEIHLFPL